MTDIQEKRISLAHEEYRLAIRKAKLDYAMKLRSLARRLRKAPDPKVWKEADALEDTAERLLEQDDLKESVDG